MFTNDKSIIDRFEELVLEKPNSPMFIDDDQVWTRASIYENTVNIVEKLNYNDISGNKVGILISNNALYVVAFLALLKCNAVIVPINHHWTSDIISNCIAKTNITTVLVDKYNHHKIKCKDISYTMIEMSNNIMHKGNKVVPAPLKQKSCMDDVSIMLATSGSTEAPKAVSLTERQMIERIKDEEKYFHLSSKDVMLISTPLYHALATRLILSTACIGNVAVIMRGFTPSKWIEAISTNLITYAICVPAQLRQITENLIGSRDCEKLLSLKKLVSTSSFLDKELKITVKDILPKECSFYNLFASSETEFIAIADIKRGMDEDDILGIPIRMEDVKIEIAGNVSHSLCVGEIVCKGAAVFEGYYREGQIISERNYGGYYRTGDLGFFDKDGCLHYAGRKKDIIISGGINIYPQDIENEVRKIDGVIDCVSYPIPDNIFGEIVGLAVVCSDVVNERIIRTHCLKYLSDYQQPRKIYIVNEIPRNEMGKISRRNMCIQIGGEFCE